MLDFFTVAAGIVAIIVVGTLIVIVYSGLFSPIVIRTGKRPIGKVVVAYKVGTGPYRGAGRIFEEVQKLDNTRRGIGIYYDSPREVSEEKLRYAVGKILTENDEKLDAELVRTFEDNGYSLVTLPATKSAVTTDFPFTTRLSIFIAIFRVYSKLTTYCEEHQLKSSAIIEVYTDNNIQYMVPLEGASEFYVPEVVSS